MRIDIREPAEGDREELKALFDAATRELRQTYRPGSVLPPVSAGSMVPDGSLVASCQGGVVGAVQYRENADSLLVQGLAVLPAARRRGVAGVLIVTLEHMARWRGKAYLELDTIKETGNPVIFERLGFQVVT